IRSFQARGCWFHLPVWVGILACAGGADDTLLRQGLDAFSRRDFAAAERAFAGLARQRPGAHAWKLLGMTYIAQAKDNQAEEPCRRACQPDPRGENPSSYLGPGYHTSSPPS